MQCDFSLPIKIITNRTREGDPDAGRNLIKKLGEQGYGQIPVLLFTGRDWVKDKTLNKIHDNYPFARVTNEYQNLQIFTMGQIGLNTCQDLWDELAARAKFYGT